MLAQVKLVANLHQGVLVRFEIAIEGDIRDLEALVLPLPEDEGVKVLAVGCDVDFRRLAVFIRLYEQRGLL